MPAVDVDGIRTHYEVTGSGPRLLLFSPGGFDATVGSWRTVGIYQRLDLVSGLSRRFRCITFDRREAGLSGGRVQRLTWADYVRQARGLLDHLGVSRAFLMGGCLGCSSVLAFTVAYPDAVAGMVLYAPAGGPRYRLKQQERFATHLAFALGEGLAAVVELARAGTASFSTDPRVGPWASVLRSDQAFAADYAALDLRRYALTVASTGRLLFDRDTVPGAEPEDLMQLEIPALVVPGQDSSHAPSAARYLQECLGGARYWDCPVAEQTADTAGRRVLEFLDEAGGGSLAAG
jgi:pimeloyl-ACP methyl ester carboxylesterase